MIILVSLGTFAGSKFNAPTTGLLDDDVLAGVQDDADVIQNPVAMPDLRRHAAQGQPEPQPVFLSRAVGFNHVFTPRACSFIMYGSRPCTAYLNVRGHRVIGGHSLPDTRRSTRVALPLVLRLSIWCSRWRRKHGSQSWNRTKSGELSAHCSTFELTGFLQDTCPRGVVTGFPGEGSRHRSTT